jgi:hypothetical protein
MFHSMKESSMALEIPGLGIIGTNDNSELPFECIELTTKQLILLRDEIDKELSDDCKNNME